MKRAKHAGGFILILAVIAAVTTSASAAPKDQQPDKGLWTTPMVTLLDAGEEPRELLRLNPTVGDVQEARMTMKMAMEQKMNGRAMPGMSIPTIQTDFRMKVKEIDTETEHITYQFEYTDVTVNDAADVPETALQRMRKMMNDMTKVTGTIVINRRGLVQSGNFDIPDDVDPMMRQQIDSYEMALSQMSAPFPQQRVGRNAKWKVEMRPEMHGMQLQQTATYTLRKSTPGNLHLDVTLDQTAGEQEMTPPGLPPNAKATVKSLTSTGSGKLVLSRTGFVPEHFEMKLEQDSEMAMEMRGQKMDIQQHMTLNMTIKPKKATDKKKKEIARPSNN